MQYNIKFQQVCGNRAFIVKATVAIKKTYLIKIKLIAKQGVAKIYKYFYKVDPINYLQLY